MQTVDFSLCADCGGTRSTSDLAITLTLLVYPFVLLVLARGYRRKGGSLLALTLPASLPPLFLGLTGAALEHVRLTQRVSAGGWLLGHRSTAAGLADAQVLLFLGALIAAIVVWFLLLRAARGNPQVPEVASRWTTVILPAAALLVLFEIQQFSWNLVRTLPPKLLLAGRLAAAAAIAAFAFALASFVWLLRSVRRGVAGLRIGWIGGLLVLAALLAIAGTSWWWMTSLRRMATG